MKAETRALSFLRTEGIVKIPFFQRSYVWNEKNWEDLIVDLLKTGKRHFLGSLILKQVETQSGSPKQVLVIDGQQRLTTLTILLRALFNSLNEKQEATQRALERVVLPGFPWVTPVRNWPGRGLDRHRRSRWLS